MLTLKLQVVLAQQHFVQILEVFWPIPHCKNKLHFYSKNVLWIMMDFPIIISYSVKLEVSPVVSLKASHWSSVAC